MKKTTTPTKNDDDLPCSLGCAVFVATRCRTPEIEPGYERCPKLMRHVVSAAILFFACGFCIVDRAGQGRAESRADEDSVCGTKYFKWSDRCALFTTLPVLQCQSICVGSDRLLFVSSHSSPV
jgi:hypothetical protein